MENELDLVVNAGEGTQFADHATELQADRQGELRRWWQQATDAHDRARGINAARVRADR